MRLRRPRTYHRPFEPNRTLATGERVQVLGEPFRIEAQAYQPNLPLSWYAGLHADGRLRPVGIGA